MLKKEDLDNLENLKLERDSLIKRINKIWNYLWNKRKYK